MHLGKLILAVAFLSGTVLAAPRPPVTAEAWTDGNGLKVNPLEPKKGRIGVLFFVLSDCPIANSYAPEMNRIAVKYWAKGVAVSIVYVDPGITSDAAMKHAREYGFQNVVVLDPTRTLAKRAGATVSPEAVVVGPKGSIVYRGRIDDRVTGFGKVRSRAARQDLRMTLDALLAGRNVPRASTPCVGCSISLP